jgi:hypothetical protein
MPTTFKISRYDGPATIAGVAIPMVHLREQIDDGHLVRRSWHGTAEVDREQAPEITPEWGESTDRVTIELPGLGAGVCAIASMTLVNGYKWELELVGIGPSPMA